MACTLIFASIHPEVLDNSIQSCPAAGPHQNDLVIDIDGDSVKLETCGDVMFIQKKFTRGSL